MVVAGCSTKTDQSSSGGDGPDKAGPPQRGGTLNVGLVAETDGWNPTASQWAGSAYQVAQTVMDPLVAFGKDNKAHPFLAKSITPNDDNTEWTIKLRSGIKFHDGTPLDADALKLQLDKDKASFLVGQAFRPLQSVTKVDPLTVKATMSERWAAFPSALAGQAGFMASPKQLNDTGKSSTDKPVGTGPYIFKEWVRDDHFTATRNPNYWRKGVAFPDTVTFRVIPDDQSRLSAVQSGQLDLMSTAVASPIIQAGRDNSLNVDEYDIDPTTMMMINTAVEPVDDVRVRRALAYATDQQQLIDTVGRGKPQKSTGPYLPGSPWYKKSSYPTKPDLGKARKLIADYKKDKGVQGDVKFTVGCTPTPSNTQAMGLIKAQWAKIGVNVDLKYTEQATYINNALNGKFTVNCWVQLGAVDPDSDSIWWNSTNANPVGSLALNFMRFKDPKVDAALKAGRASSDLAERKKAYATVWERFATEVPYVWLTHPHDAKIWSKKVHGVGEAKLPDGTPLLKNRGAVPDVVALSSVWVSK